MRLAVNVASRLPSAGEGPARPERTPLPDSETLAAPASEGVRGEGSAREATRSGVLELDVGRRRCWVDEGLCELSGLPRDLRELDFYCWLECVHPEDRTKLRRAVEAAPGQRRRFASEFRVVLPDGGVRRLSSRGGIERIGRVSLRVTGADAYATAIERDERFSTLPPASPDLGRAVSDGRHGARPALVQRAVRQIAVSVQSARALHDRFQQRISAAKVRRGLPQ